MCRQMLAHLWLVASSFSSQLDESICHFKEVWFIYSYLSHFMEIEAYFMQTV